MPTPPAASRPARPRLSVVVPCLNEAEVIDQTAATLFDVLGLRSDVDLEVVFVDDGSTDDTPARLRALGEADARVVAVFLARTFGQQRATAAGLRFATGDAVVVMDADLQDPPEVVPRMLAAWREGADVAYGTRRSRAGETVFKRWSAAAFYRLLARVSEVDVPRDTGDFRLMDRVVVDALLALPEQDRFLRGQVAWLGFRQVAVPFDRAPRAAGRSAYRLRDGVALALDGLFVLSVAPLRVLAVIGLALLAAALPVALWAAWTATLLGAVLAAILGVGGLQLIGLAGLAEVASRALREARRRPPYVVREVVGLTPAVVREASRHGDIRRARRPAEGTAISGGS